jgi:hypothetical protein
MRQILLVANQTLGGERLKEVVRERIGYGPCNFTIVVPIAPAAHEVKGAEWAGGVYVNRPITTGPSKNYESARVEAVRRLAAAIHALKELGASADGDTGSEDPVAAVGHCLKAQSYDEIIVSTLPKTVSRWLHQDVPHRIHRKYKIPVTTVTAREPMPT